MKYNILILILGFLSIKLVAGEGKFPSFACQVTLGDHTRCFEYTDMGIKKITANNSDWVYECKDDGKNNAKKLKRCPQKSMSYCETKGRQYGTNGGDFTFREHAYDKEEQKNMMINCEDKDGFSVIPTGMKLSRKLYPKNLRAKGRVLRGVKKAKEYHSKVKMKLCLNVYFGMVQGCQVKHGLNSKKAFDCIKRVTDNTSKVCGMGMED